MTDISADEVLDSLGAHMAALELARYSQTEPYGADQLDLPAFFDGALPPDPDTAVAAQILDDRRENDGPMSIRIRFRATTLRAVEKFGDNAFESLHVGDHAFRPQVWSGEIRVIDVRRTVRAQATEDANGRWMRADDYDLIIANTRSTTS